MTSNQEQGPRTSYVYAIGDAGQRHVKIGHTIDPARRVVFIQTTCPYGVSILWKTEGGPDLEGALHRQFADYHSRGEWFEFPEGNAVELISQAAGKLLSERVHVRSHITRADAGVAAMLRIPRDSIVLEVERVTYKGGEPVELTVTWARSGRAVPVGPMKGPSRILRESLDDLEPGQ